MRAFSYTLTGALLLSLTLGGSAHALFVDCPTLATFGHPNNTTIGKAAIRNLYWGSYWTSAGGSALRSQDDQNTSTITDDIRFYEIIQEYDTSTPPFSGYYNGSEQHSVFNTPTVCCFQDQITEQQIRDELTKEIAASGIMPRLANGYDQIYVIHLAPSVVDLGLGGFTGHHKMFFTTILGQTFPVYYAVLAYTGNATFDSSLAAHELWEAITNPAGDTETEVGDLCSSRGDTLDGVAVQEVWSNRTCGCVAASSLPPPHVIFH
jgi:hypothetical protein